MVHIPMSSGLSSSCETAMALSMDEAYEGKVFVVDNQRVSVTQYQSVKDALMLAAQGAGRSKDQGASGGDKGRFGDLYHSGYA